MNRIITPSQLRTIREWLAQRSANATCGYPSNYDMSNNGTGNMDDMILAMLLNGGMTGGMGGGSAALAGMLVPNGYCGGGDINIFDDVNGNNGGGGGDAILPPVTRERDIQPKSSTTVVVNLTGQAPNLRFDDAQPLIVADTRQVSAAFVGQNQNLNSELLQLVRCVAIRFSVVPNTQTVQTANLLFSITSLPIDKDVTPYSLGDQAPLSGRYIRPGQEVVIILEPKVNLPGANFFQRQNGGEESDIFDECHFGRRLIVVCQHNGPPQNQLSINCKIEISIAQMNSRGGMYLNTVANCQPVCGRQIGGQTYLQMGGVL